MVDPVTTAAAATVAKEAAGAASDAASSVATNGGNLISRLFGGIGGGAQEVFSWNTLKNFALSTLAITALKMLMPEGWRSAATAAGGEAYANKIAQQVQEGGIKAVVLDSAKQAAALSAGWSAVTGTFNGAGGGITGTIASLGVLGTAGAVLIGAMNTPATPVTPAAAPNSRRTGETRTS